METTPGDQKIMRIKQENWSNGLNKLATRTYFGHGPRFAWQPSLDNDERSITTRKSMPRGGRPKVHTGKRHTIPQGTVAIHIWMRDRISSIPKVLNDTFTCPPDTNLYVARLLASLKWHPGAYATLHTAQEQIVGGRKQEKPLHLQCLKSTLGITRQEPLTQK